MTVKEMKERFDKIQSPKMYIMFDFLYETLDYKITNKVPVWCGKEEHKIEWKRLDDVLANRRGCGQCQLDKAAANAKKNTANRTTVEEKYKLFLERCQEDGYEAISTIKDIKNTATKITVRCLRCGGTWTLMWRDFVKVKQNHLCNLQDPEHIRKNVKYYIDEFGFIPLIPLSYSKKYVGKKDKIQWRCFYCGKVYSFSMGQVVDGKKHCRCREYGED